jgi:hypothetical protein
MVPAGSASPGIAGPVAASITPASEESVRRVEAQVRKVDLLVQTVLGLTVLLIILVIILILK